MVELLTFGVADELRALTTRPDLGDEVLEAADVRFVVVDSEAREVPLCDGGADMLVTKANFAHFVHLLRTVCFPLYLETVTTGVCAVSFE